MFRFFFSYLSLIHVHVLIMRCSYFRNLLGRMTLSIKRYTRVPARLDHMKRCSMTWVLHGIYLFMPGIRQESNRKK